MDTEDGNMTAFSPSGLVLWKAPFDYFASDAVLSNDTLYYTVNSATQYGVTADLWSVDLNNTLLWRYPGIAEGTNNTAFVNCARTVLTDKDGSVYFTRFNGTGDSPYDSIFAIGQSGEIRWEYSDTKIGTPALNDDTLVFWSSSGITALDPGGNIRWKIIVPNANGIAAIGSDGTVYAGTQKGIVAIGINPIVLGTGALILIPAILVCSAVLWKARKMA